VKLIVGLGNPGLVYAGSRHNIGFAIVKSLSRRLETAFKKDGSVLSLVAKCDYAGHKVILALPHTFMNLSGAAVKALLKKFKIGLDDLLVVCDDLDLELGRIRIRAKGSSGGQRGLVSVIEQLGSRDFNRLRFGIGRPAKPEDAARYVLGGFSRREKALVEEAGENAVRCCLGWIENGIISTMDSFNTRSRNE